MAKPAKKPAKKATKAPKAKPLKEPEAKGKPVKDKAVKPKPAKAKAPKPKAKKKALKRAIALPLPADLPVPATPAKPRPDPVAGALVPFSVAGADAAILDALWRTVEARRLAGDVEHSHSARLLSRGTAKVAQKLGEEAVECVIEATQGHRAATVLESADLLYHLVVVWVDAGIRPEEVWAELARRQGISGIAEKAARPKGIVRAARTTKLP
jgi:phosphoribosyl-ATP pyrophosphohydrolase